MKRSLLLPPLMTALLVAATIVHANEPADQAAYKGDAAKGQPLASTVCGACHGPDGNGPIPIYPKLAGQHADYLYKQMANFKATEGKPAERTNDIMNGMIMPYTEEQMRDFAAYFASQTQKNETTATAESVAAGQKLYRSGDANKGLPACSGCHGPAGAGMPAQYRASPASIPTTLPRS